MAFRHSLTALCEVYHSSAVPSGAGNRSGSLGPVQRPCGPKVAWTSGQLESSHSGSNQCSLRPVCPEASTLWRNTQRSTPILPFILPEREALDAVASLAGCSQILPFILPEREALDAVASLAGCSQILPFILPEREAL